MSASSAFLQLHPRIQRYLWSEGWGALRAVQGLAIPKILPADRDVIVAASTASGKTGAAFLPALTHLLGQERSGLIVYVSPLKALINDQFERLDRLCENLEVPVWPWHGDISATSKTRFLRDPWGALLITPESLEALFCNRGTAVASLFGMAAGAIDVVRPQQVSKALRDSYTATNHAIIGYIMLQTTGVGLNDQETADLAERHLADHVANAQAIASVMPSLVVKDLSDDVGNVSAGAAEAVTTNQKLSQLYHSLNSNSAGI